jgi:hypothetical protein
MIYDAQGDVIGARNNGRLTGSCAPSKRNNLQALKDAFKIHLHAMKHPKPGVIQKKNKCCYLRTDPSRERRCNAMSNVMGSPCYETPQTWSNTEEEQVLLLEDGSQ